MLLRALKKALRSITPHGIIAIRDRRLARKSLWRGVEDTFADMPAEGRGFESDAFTHSMRERLAADNRAIRSEGAVSREQEYQGNHGELISVTALLPSLNRRLRIVDFGGNVGLAYPLLRTSLPATTSLAYDVVELPRVCAEGRHLFANDDRIVFHEDVRSVAPDPDIVYANGALQYIRDYEAALAGLLGLDPRIVLLCDLPGGNGPRFATAQEKYVGGSVPSWFFNIPSVVSFVESRGYSIRAHIRTDIGYDMDNFPPSHRSPWLHTLLFTRTSAS
jgi:putative methyltransferase (TIGR04325 family)